MGIGTSSEYVKFYVDLKMGDSVSLSSFLNNEKRILKGKLENKNLDKEKIQKGIEILQILINEINESGEEEVLKRYGK